MSDLLRISYTCPLVTPRNAAISEVVQSLSSVSELGVSPSVPEFLLFVMSYNVTHKCQLSNNYQQLDNPTTAGRLSNFYMAVPRRRVLGRLKGVHRSLRRVDLCDKPIHEVLLRRHKRPLRPSKLRISRRAVRLRSLDPFSYYVLSETSLNGHRDLPLTGTQPSLTLAGQRVQEPFVHSEASKGHGMPQNASEGILTRSIGHQGSL
jgi:hypothetical protein